MKTKMFRCLAQIFFTIAIFGFYSVFLFEKKIEPENYVLVNSFVSFCIIFIFIIEIRTKFFLSKKMFLSYPFSHLKLIRIRISMLFKKNFLLMILFVPPIILFFIKELTVSEKLSYYIFSSLQNLFTVYLFITIYDLFFIKGYEKHIINLPAIIIITLTFLSNNDINKLYIYNPFGGIINLPIYVNNPLFYPLPVFLFLIIYLFNKLFLHKVWIKNNC